MKLLFTRSDHKNNFYLFLYVHRRRIFAVVAVSGGGIAEDEVMK
jgi:hypothetical protein